MTWIFSLLSGLVGPLVGLLEKYGMGLAGYAKGRQDAANKHRMQDDEHALETIRDRARINDDVRRLPADGVRDELEPWER